MLNIILIVTLVVFIIIAVFMILTMVGGNMNKSVSEIMKEDEEQMEYLRNYKRKKGIEEKTEFVTRKQIASYGMVAREYLKHTGNLEISNKEFGKYILTLIDLYSPAEIEKQAENLCEKI